LPQVILIVLDGMGVGALPDAARYGDSGSDTLGHMSSAMGGLELPVLERLGLGNVHAIAGVSPVAQAEAAYGRLQEVSAGKDSTTGHWELMGLVVETPFPTYPDGFPPEVIEAFRERTGYDVLGNVPASGTDIIERLGDEHVATGKLIVYTSADSVFQIAAHEEIVPTEELYRVCALARELLVPPHQVSRVIARPFAGASGAYRRTAGRRDFSVEPPPGLLLAQLAEARVPVISIGKIYDLYAGQGIAEKHVAHGNAEGMETLERIYRPAARGQALTLLNLVDFDMLYGHRNDPAGMAKALREFDRWLGSFLPRMHMDDLMIITADHGNDPTTPSTDHSREFVPLLVAGSGRRFNLDLGLRSSFADVAATLADFFGVGAPGAGVSFWPELQTKIAGG
jgi:phosphopentomutase